MSAARADVVWKVGSLRSDYKWAGPLVAYWEVYLDPISDDYTPNEISAVDLFRKWTERVREQYPQCLIPIYWFVQCPSQKKFERMPFQDPHVWGNTAPEENFLTFFTWPVSSATGAPVNWLTLPVADKRWRKGRSDKGGFIQEATGWKPGILQPAVYLPALMSVLG